MSIGIFIKILSLLRISGRLKLFFICIMGDGDSEGENLMKLRINHHQQKKEILIVAH